MNAVSTGKANYATAIPVHASNAQGLPTFTADLYISLRSLSYKHLVFLRNMVLTSPFVCDKKFNEIILAFSSKLIKPKRQLKAEK